MPCDGSYMNPTRREVESVRVAESLEYVLNSKGQQVPEWVFNAARLYYGDKERLNEMAVLLCSECENMTGEQESCIIYDGRNPKARILATWWDAHQDADRKRVAKEEIEEARQLLRRSGLAKLSAEEIKVLGL